MKRGDRVVYIGNDSFYTYGKVYEVKSDMNRKSTVFMNKIIDVVDDYGNSNYPLEYTLSLSTGERVYNFIMLSEWRQIQIDKLIYE